MQIKQPDKTELPSLSTLLVSLLVATALTLVLLITVILPAERGLDVTGIGNRFHLTRMGKLKVAMSEPDAPIFERPHNSDTLTVTLMPLTGIEVKMDMSKGYIAQYTWETDGGVVYHDTHGDIYADDEIYVTYLEADNVSSDAGDITAPYGGYHGWYWKNNSDQTVTITLDTTGQYHSIEEK